MHRMCHYEFSLLLCRRSRKSILLASLARARHATQSRAGLARARPRIAQGRQFYDSEILKCRSSLRLANAGRSRQFLIRDRTEQFSVSTANLFWKRLKPVSPSTTKPPWAQPLRVLAPGPAPCSLIILPIEKFAHAHTEKSDLHL